MLGWGSGPPTRSASSGRGDGGSLEGSLAQVALAAAVLLEVGNAAAGHLAHLQRWRECSACESNPAQLALAAADLLNICTLQQQVALHSCTSSSTAGVRQPRASKATGA